MRERASLLLELRQKYAVKSFHTDSAAMLKKNHKFLLSLLALSSLWLALSLFSLSFPLSHSPPCSWWKKVVTRGAIIFRVSRRIESRAERLPLNIKSQRELVLITAQIPRNVTIVTDSKEERTREYLRLPTAQTVGQLFYPTLRRSLIIPYKVIFVISPRGGITREQSKRHLESRMGLEICFNAIGTLRELNACVSMSPK